MNKKIFVLLPSLLMVMACNSVASSSSSSSANVSEESSSEAISSGVSSSEESSGSVINFAEAYAKLNRAMLVNGTAKEVLVDSTTLEEKAVVEGELSLILGNESYHIEITGDLGLTSTLYKGEDDTVLHYYITSNNEVEYEVLEDDEGNLFQWKDYDNPFRYISAESFTADEADPSVYRLDIKDTEKSAEAIYATSNLVYSTYPSLEDFSLKIVDDEITSIHIKTPVFTDSLGSSYYEYDLTISLPEDFEEYPLPTPLETKPYHTTLRNALTTLENDTYKAVQLMTYYGDDTEYVTDCYYGEGGDSYLFIYDQTYDESDGYIVKDGEAHQLVYDEENGTYSYNTFTMEKAEKLTGFNIATEFFTYDETTGAYTLTGEIAGVFLYGIQPFEDPQNYASTEVNIYLNSNNKISKIEASGDGHVSSIEYLYEGYTLPFDLETISAFDPLPALLANHAGSYTYSNYDDTITGTLVVTETSVTLDGVLATDLSVNDYGELAFLINGEEYSINSRGNRLYKGYDMFYLTKVE